MARARELLVSAATGFTVFAIGRILNGDNIGLWGNTATNVPEAYNTANFGDYAIPMPELGVSGFYEATMPSVFNAERAVEIIYYSQAGADPAESDTKLSGSLYELQDDWVATEALAV